MSSATRNVLRILLVEDNAGDAALLCHALDDVPERPYIVHHVDRLDEGVRTALLGVVDIAILDLSLPDSQGPETVTRFLTECPGIPVLVLTGQSDTHVGAEMVRRGAQDCLTKGMADPAHLAHVIDRAIESSRLASQVSDERERQMQSADRLGLIIESNADAMLMIDREGLVQFANSAAAKLFGRSIQALTGQPIGFPIVSGDSTEVDIRRPDGSQVVAEMRSVDLESTGHAMTLASLRDVTQRAVMEERLRQAERLEVVGRLAGGVAHDFNNMLSVIMGSTEMALEDVALTEALREDMQQILHAARRSADLTHQLLAFAREQPIAPQTINLNEKVESVLKMLRRLIGEDIELAWRPKANLWPVKMDASQVDQILANLCVNARDAISGAGQVTIETGQVVFDETYQSDHADYTPGEYVVLAVSDDGCGMDEAVKQHLFEPFFTTKGLGKGTGLGLATVYGIVQQNLGMINVYSEVGHGTTFRVYLPHDKSQAEGQAKLLHEPVSPGQGELILMVEDEAAILRMGRRMLESMGYTVLSASTPDVAIQLAEGHPGPIDLLITDVVMPKMSGRELAERLSATRPAMKRLFMSGYTANVIADRGVLDDGVEFIQKPFSVSDLSAKVREVLDRPQQVRGNPHHSPEAGRGHSVSIVIPTRSQEDPMTDKEVLYTAGKLAAELGISAGKVRKLMEALEMEPCQVKRGCKYYGAEELAKLKAEMDKAE